MPVHHRCPLGHMPMCTCTGCECIVLAQEYSYFVHSCSQVCVVFVLLRAQTLGFVVKGACAQLSFCFHFLFYFYFNDCKLLQTMLKVFFMPFSILRSFSRHSKYHRTWLIFRITQLVMCRGITCTAVISTNTPFHIYLQSTCGLLRCICHISVSCLIHWKQMNICPLFRVFVSVRHHRRHLVQI